MKYMILATALISTAIFANDVYLIGGGFSKHFKSGNQNETHPSIGIQVDNMSVIYVRSNSIESKSIQFSYSDNLYESEYVDLGYRLGLASGYKKGTHFGENNVYSGTSFELGNSGIIPIVAAEFSFHTPIPNFDIVIDVIPTVAMFGFKYRIE